MPSCCAAPSIDAAGGFDESLRGGAEDWDLWFRLLRHGYRFDRQRESRRRLPPASGQHVPRPTDDPSRRGRQAVRRCRAVGRARPRPRRRSRSGGTAVTGAVGTRAGEARRRGHRHGDHGDGFARPARQLGGVRAARRSPPCPMSEGPRSSRRRSTAPRVGSVSLGHSPTSCRRPPGTSCSASAAPSPRRSSSARSNSGAEAARPTTPRRGVDPSTSCSLPNRSPTWALLVAPAATIRPDLTRRCRRPRADRRSEWGERRRGARPVSLSFPTTTSSPASPSSRRSSCAPPTGPVTATCFALPDRAGVRATSSQSPVAPTPCRAVPRLGRQPRCRARRRGRAQRGAGHPTGAAHGRRRSPAGAVRTSRRGFHSRTVHSTARPSTRLAALRDRHVGETAVIIGNGPSLNDTELEMLTDVPTFGVNAIFLAAERFPKPITYYVVEDTSVFSENTRGDQGVRRRVEAVPGDVPAVVRRIRDRRSHHLLPHERRLLRPQARGRRAIRASRSTRRSACTAARA